MASYKIEWKQSARRELRKLDKSLVQQILRAVEKLETFAVGVEALAGRRWAPRNVSVWGDTYGRPAKASSPTYLN